MIKGSIKRLTIFIGCLIFSLVASAAFAQTAASPTPLQNTGESKNDTFLVIFHEHSPT